MFVSYFVDWALSSVIFAVFIKYFGTFADACFFPVYAKRDYTAAAFASDCRVLYALGFRSERI